MRYTPFALAAALLFSAACSNDDSQASFVSEAQAATPQQKDYGWRTTPDFATKQEEVREYQ